WRIDGDTAVTVTRTVRVDRCTGTGARATDEQTTCEQNCAPHRELPYTGRARRRSRFLLRVAEVGSHQLRVAGQQHLDQLARHVGLLGVGLPQLELLAERIADREQAGSATGWRLLGLVLGISECDEYREVDVRDAVI